jgi:hypothetical protein
MHLYWHNRVYCSRQMNAPAEVRRPPTRTAPHEPFPAIGPPQSTNEPGKGRVTATAAPWRQRLHTVCHHQHAAMAKAGRSTTIMAPTARSFTLDAPPHPADHVDLVAEFDCGSSGWARLARASFRLHADRVEHRAGSVDRPGTAEPSRMACGAAISTRRLTVV